MFKEQAPHIVVCEDKESVTLSIAGDINAQFAWPLLKDLPSLKKTIRINLDRVQYINSVGVKNWIRTFPYAKKKVELFAVNVHMMDAFNMTPAMRLGSQIVTFYVPVYCKNCEEKFELVSVKDIDFQSESKIKVKPCVCGSVPEIDTDLDMYFSCLGNTLSSAS